MKNKVHLICNAHLDPVWQWCWPEGCSEALATFRNAIEILHEYPELIFNHNEAILYQWVQQYNPPLFDDICGMIKEGRWFISGGWYLQPDVNLIPIGNLLRHIRFGRDYFNKEFGVTPKVAYNFDSFGHPFTLPGILKNEGYEMYIHQRPEKHLLALPGSLYNWKGADGQTITCYRIEIGLYHTERENITERLEQAVNTSLSENRDVALFWGLGNHGGGATRLDLNRIREFSATEQRIDIIHSTTDQFHESIKPIISSLPIFDSSLQRVFAGCYSSLSRIKRSALEASGAAEQAEELLTYSSIPNQKSNLKDIWEDILFNDFHDILPGTCIEPAEKDAFDLYGRALENIRRLNMQSITSINRSVPELNAHIPVTLFNSYPNMNSFPVEFECMSDHRPLWVGDWELKVYNQRGREIPSQEEIPEARLPFHDWRRKICFMGTNLESGVHHFALEKRASVKKRPVIDYPETSTNYSLDLNSACIVVSDEADSWGTDTWSWRKILGRFKKNPAANQTIARGLVRSIDEDLLSYHHSKIIVHTIHYQHWPVTEYRFRIVWNEEKCRLKISIQSGLINPSLVAEITGGIEKFPADGQEYVHQRYLVLKTQDQTLNIAHNGLHGFDFMDGEVRLSVLRSAAYCHEKGCELGNKPYPKHMDIGNHEVRLALWEGDLEAPAIADWLNTPPLIWPHLPIGK